jgi:HlyD family secretion protein
MGMDRQIEKKKWPPRRIAAVAGGVLFVAFAVYVFALRPRTSSLNVEKDRLTISTVTRGPFQEYIAVMGNVIPRQTHFLTAEEGGRVEDIYIRAGTMVKKGDPLLKLSNATLALDIMWRESDFFTASNNLRATRLAMEQFELQLRNEINEVEKDLQQETRRHDRTVELYKSQLISQQEYELAMDQYDYLVKKKAITLESQKNNMAIRKAQLDGIEASVQRLDSSLSAARKRLENLVVRAPVEGFLTALNAEIGESKTMGQALGQIDILEGFKVRAQIDEHYLPRTALDRTGSFTLGGRTFGLAVKKIYPQVLEGRFEVDLEFSGDEPPGITRGQTLHIDLNLSDVSEAVLLPRGGFYTSTGGNWVFLVEPVGKTAVKRMVKLGRYNTDAFEVLEGLEAGDEVVTSSYESFGDIGRLVFK